MPTLESIKFWAWTSSLNMFKSRREAEPLHAVARESALLANARPEETNHQAYIILHIRQIPKMSMIQTSAYRRITILMLLLLLLLILIWV